MGFGVFSFGVLDDLNGGLNGKNKCVFGACFGWF